MKSAQRTPGAVPLALGLLALSAVLRGGAGEAGLGKVDKSAGRPDAAEEAQPEHGKLNTADASPVDPGHVELEFGYGGTHSRRCWDEHGNGAGRGRRMDHAAGLSLTVGVVDNLDLSLAGCYLWLRDDDAEPDHGEDWADLEFGARYRFLNCEEHHLELAWIAGFTLPTGSRDCAREIGAGQRYWSCGQALALTKDWGRWTTNAEVGYALPFGEHRDDARGELGVNLACGYQALPWLQPELELNYAREFVKGGHDVQVLAITAGLVMPLNDRVRVNVGVQQDLWGRNADQATSWVLCVKLAF